MNDPNRVVVRSVADSTTVAGRLLNEARRILDTPPPPMSFDPEIERIRQLLFALDRYNMALNRAHYRLEATLYPERFEEMERRRRERREREHERHSTAKD